MKIDLFTYLTLGESGPTTEPPQAVDRFCSNFFKMLIIMLIMACFTGQIELEKVPNLGGIHPPPP